MEYNPDCEPGGAETLRTLAHEWRGTRPLAAARKLFPGRTKGIVRATIDLRNYAWNKATAMDCRRRGDIQGALMYEGICDRIYTGLPEWARW